MAKECPGLAWEASGPAICLCWLVPLIHSGHAQRGNPCRKCLPFLLEQVQFSHWFYFWNCLAKGGRVVTFSDLSLPAVLLPCLLGLICMCKRLSVLYHLLVSFIIMHLNLKMDSPKTPSLNLKMDSPKTPFLNLKMESPLCPVGSFNAHVQSIRKVALAWKYGRGLTVL